MGVCVVTDDGVVDEGAGEVVVGGVVLVKHGGGDVGDVAAGVGLAGDVDFKILDAEDILPVFEEFDEVLGDFFFRGGGYFADGVAGADRLLDPEHIGEVDPRVRILDGGVGSRLPSKPSVFLEEAFEGTATRASVQPDCDFVNRLTNGWLEDVEKAPGRIA